jgi:hypothetical protein
VYDRIFNNAINIAIARTKVRGQHMGRRTSSMAEDCTATAQGLDEFSEGT